MKLGLDTFSLRWQGWTATQLVEYAAARGLGSVQFSERVALGSLDHDDLVALGETARRLDVRLEVGMRSIDRLASTFDPAAGSGEDQLRDMLGIAELVGSGVVRCFLGMQSDREGPSSVAEHIAECVRVLSAVAAEASDRGIRIALENHGGGDLHARELLALIEAVGSDAVGACLDTGNSAYAGEDPVFAARMLAPHVVTCQLRDVRVWRTDVGCAVQWVPVGEGDIDIVEVARILQDAVPDAVPHLEIITARAPKEIDFLRPSTGYWDLYPDLLAADFAQFLRWAESGTERPLRQREIPPSMLAPADDDMPAFATQQLQHVDRSIDWMIQAFATP